MIKSLLFPVASQLSELKGRILFLLAALVVFRLGTHIPLPGMNPETLQQALNGPQSGLMSLFNMFSGGALSRYTLFALGIMPFISASIVAQLASFVVPQLEQLKKEGETGRRKLTKYTRFAAVGLALVQGFAIAKTMESTPGLVLNPGLSFELLTMLSLAAGATFVMWLGEQISERGLGNGTSILIFASIASGVPGAIASLAELVRTGGMGMVTAIGVVLFVAATTYAVAFIEKGQRKIAVSYARAPSGHKTYGGAVQSHLPLKLNMAGVIPPIFASTVLLVPATVLGWFSSDAPAWLKDTTMALSPGHWVYTVLFAITIVFFTFVYTALTFNSTETSDNLRKSGGFIPGIRPGDQTAEYLGAVLKRLTLVGSAYLTLLCLVPQMFAMKYNLPFNFGGTSLLIIVVVTTDFKAQVQNYLAAHSYHSLLKK